MCSENIFIAGRYNKYQRNLSQSPWIDKDDVRIKQSVQELIEDGLKKYLKSDKLVFSSSGREDVDVRMLGKGRPFVFRVVNPREVSSYNKETMMLIQRFVNAIHPDKIQIRDLQVVTKDGVSKNLKEGEENKTKEYRALCCCSRQLSREDVEKVSSITDLLINQLTPIRVLHRRSLAVRRRKIHRLKIDSVKLGDFESVTSKNLDNVFALTLLTEAGTYIKEFVHGDFGRTEPNLSTILGNCDTDLMELDVMEVYLDWPPPLSEAGEEEDTGIESTVTTNDNLTTDKMDKSEISLEELYKRGLKAMQDAEAKPRSDARQDLYIQARRIFEQAMDLVESLSLFSDNETIDDVATVDLKYLLIPAFLSKIAMSSECGSNRLYTFNRAEQLTRKFFDRIVKYGLGDESIERAIKADETDVLDQSSSVESASQNRSSKIEKYKKMKLLESRIEELERRVTSGHEVDNEIAREYYMSLLKKWIDNSLESLEREIKPALFFERNRNGDTNQIPSPSTSKPAMETKLQTFMIVKDDIQKRVFGLGYPSKPTVTVDQFITKKINDGDLVFEAHKEVYANSLQRYAEQPTLVRDQEEASDEEREEKEDRDDAEELSRKRRWDEFKDENPRGSGNRHNMG